MTQTDAIEAAIIWLDESSLCEASKKCKSQLKTLLSTLASVEAERDRMRDCLDAIARGCLCPDKVARKALEATP